MFVLLEVVGTEVLPEDKDDSSAAMSGCGCKDDDDDDMDLVVMLVEDRWRVALAAAEEFNVLVASRGDAGGVAGVKLGGWSSTKWYGMRQER